MQKLTNPIAIGAILAVTMLVAGIPAEALAQRDASSKIRGDYNFYSGSSGRTYQRHAADHSRVLHNYSSAGKPVNKAIVQEHATAIRQNVDASKKAYGRLSEAAKKDAAAAKHLETIQSAHEKGAGNVRHAGRRMRKAEGDSVTICKCCVDIEKHLKAADEWHDKLMKQLKLEEPKNGSGK